MEFNGMHLSGFACTEKGMQVCGMGTLRNFSYTTVIESEYKNTLQKIINAIRYTGNPSPHGILNFALSSAQINNRGGFLKWLCEHKKTKCVHWYTNDAHTPNMVFICVLHVNETTSLPQNQPQLMEVFNKTQFSNGQWKMKEK